MCDLERLQCMLVTKYEWIALSAPPPGSSSSSIPITDILQSVSSRLTIRHFVTVWQSFSPALVHQCSCGQSRAPWVGRSHCTGLLWRDLPVSPASEGWGSIPFPMWIVSAGSCSRRSRCGQRRIHQTPSAEQEQEQKVDAVVYYGMDYNFISNVGECFLGTIAMVILGNGKKKKKSGMKTGNIFFGMQV